MADDRIMMKNPNTGRDDVRIKVGIYEPVSTAILQTLAEGPLPNAQLPDEVERRTSAELWEDASVMWFTTTVKLHLEATGMLSKTGSPQVLAITDSGHAMLNDRIDNPTTGS